MKLWYERGAWASVRARQKITDIQPDKVRSIAVIRHAALGDMVLVRAFLLELRRHFPNASITLSIVTNYAYGVPEDLVDRIHSVYGSDRRDVGLREQIKRGRELGYHDLLFDLAATPRSFWTCLLNRAGFKVGFPYYAMQRRMFYDAAVLRSDLRFEVDTMLDMLHLLGLNTTYPPQYNLPPAAKTNEQPCIVYFPSASIPGKCWPKPHFAELVGRLSAKYPEHKHIVLEGVAEWESAEEIMAPNQHRENVVLQKAKNLEATTGLLQGADCVISNDTGVRNLAIAAETATVGIFFSTVPFRYWPRCSKHQAVFNPDGSIPDVDSVVTAVDDVLK